MGVHERLAEWSLWGWPLIANHLWQATLLSLLAAGVARLLKRAPARARYVVWLIASLKFAVPSALIVLLATQTGIKFPSLFDSAETPRGVTVIYQVAEPVAQNPQPGFSSDLARGHNEIYCALTATWVTGAATLVALWLRRRRRFSLSIRAGRSASAGREVEALNRVRAWLAIKRPVELVIMPTLIEPGVWRVWHPVVVMPAKMSEDLTTAELEAVMMHEMIHVARWDNLANSFQMFLCCLFWFHPIVWLIDRKLMAEREQVCDERVIEFGGESKVYASSLLKVFRFCLGCRLAGVSYATGSNLRRRIEQIMADNTDRRFALSHRILVAAIAMAVISFSLAGMFGHAGAAAQGKRGNRIEPGGPDAGVPGGVIGGVPGGVVGGVVGGIPGGVTGGPQDQLREPPPPPPRNSQEIIEKIEQAPEVTAQFVNRDDTPLAITDMKVKSLLIPSDESGGQGYYAVKTIISMVNNTDRRIKSIRVRFTNKGEKFIFATDRMKLNIEPHGTYIFGKSASELIYFGPRLGDPESIVAEVIGVRFEDGRAWGQSPNYPPPPPPPPAEAAAPAAPAAPADSIEPSAPAPPSGDAAPDGQKVIRIPDDVLRSSVIKRVNAEYPPIARAAQLSGSVDVEIIVNEEGNVTSARAISGHPLLKAAAVEAARQWQFKSTAQSGAPTRIIGTLTFNFQP
ncbi:MAG TPA: M56 family metallopeptidase [Blastocatellia bacterium]|nr:M56 family metallopeptidase [Blastocatellia bacterium]